MGKKTKPNRVVDRIDMHGVGEGIGEPTAEQAQRFKFERVDIRTEDGHFQASPYRRQPLFETLAKTSTGFTPDELAALRFYRGAHDRSDRSFTTSCLNVSGGGGNRLPPIASYTPAMLIARDHVLTCERSAGVLTGTLRAVALEDRTFSEIAVERYGSRRQDWLAADHQGGPIGHVEKLVPSGSARTVIREEFMAALRLLAICVRSMVSTPGIEEIWVDIQKDGKARLQRGALAPNGSHRLYGSSAVIDEVLVDLRDIYGDELMFASASAAIVALRDTARGRLGPVDQPEAA